MKKKLLIELFIYIVIVVIGFILIFTYKPKHKPIDVPADYKVARSENSVFVSIKQ